ncbi:MAG: L-rhamnose isomerase [Limnochordia bacterium]|nr:L-rhamnose isomerase [Limnochordia bacterium]
MIVQEYNRLGDCLADRGINVDDVKERLKEQKLETPSWAYGDGGTRFYVFKQAAAARTVWEKTADAAEVHKYTGITPTVALHIPWDMVDNWEELRNYAEEQGVRIGSINPNVFQEPEYKLGSVTNVNGQIREKATDHMLECVEIMKRTGSKVLSMWLADGTNYPGQGDFRRRKRWMEEAFAKVYGALDDDMVMLIEYKMFEPGFYHTDLADWGMATNLAKRLGPKAKTLVDLGHHALGTNIEHIVAYLIDEGKLGGFHFNNKKYADDDLTSGSINPYELFLIYNELAKAETDPDGGLEIAYMIDQSHNIKPKMQAMIQSVQNLQTAYAKALLVNQRQLEEYQAAGDVVGAEEVLMTAFNTDVTPLLEAVRRELGVPEQPLDAFRKSGYEERVAKERSK